MLVVGAVLAFLRFVLLLGDAKKDLALLDGAARYVIVTYEFFVKAAWVHIVKSTTIFVGGGAIVLSSLPDVPTSVRLIVSPIALLAVLSLMLFIGELENRARRESKESFQEEQKGERP